MFIPPSRNVSVEIIPGSKTSPELIQAARDFITTHELAKLNVKARVEKFSSYPNRFSVPDEKVSWETSYPEYSPQYFTAQKVFDAYKKYVETKVGRVVDPEDVSKLERKITSYETTQIKFDSNGRPLNPRGRTGLQGRGVLEKYGPNFAADPIITRLNPLTGQFEMLAIKRKDNGQWAIPGGKVEEGEKVSETARREFEEEAGVALDMSDAVEVYKGYVDDPRNTDNAWFETSVFHKHLSPEFARLVNPKAGSDAEEVTWIPLTEGGINNLYASHGDFARLVLARLTENK